jgi:hypothetical protein
MKNDSQYVQTAEDKPENAVASAQSHRINAKSTEEIKALPSKIKMGYPLTEFNVERK